MSNENKIKTSMLEVPQVPQAQQETKEKKVEATELQEADKLKQDDTIFIEDEETFIPQVEVTTTYVQDEDEPDPVIQYSTKQQNTIQSFQTSLPKDQGSPETIPIPPATMQTIENNVEQIPNINLVVSESQSKWASTLAKSTELLPIRDPYTEHLEDTSSSFKQEITHNGKSIRGRSPNYKKNPGENIVEGERAILQLITHLGIGGLFRAPLWGSGIWVTFKPATESEMLELNRIIAADKIQSGRWSYGLSLSSTVVYTLDRVFEFALNHVYNTSVKPDELPIHKLRDYIVPQDINSFIWGFLCACYPSGYQYETSCINNPSKCTHVFTETLNVTKLQWTDESMLSDWQKQHMSTLSANAKSLDSIKRYQEEMTRMQPKRILLNKDTKHEIAFTIKTPTITEYINQGHRWISGMVDNVNTVLGSDATDEQRNTMINRLNKATTLCQYSHWIKSIEYGDLSVSDDVENRSTSVTNDITTVEDALKFLSGIDPLRESLITEILKYIGESTISVIGVPSYECPMCGTSQQDSKVYPRHVNVIPLDMLQVFFDLLLRRLSRIETRSNQ